MLPHKILCSEMLHVIPNCNNLSTATLQQEARSRCGVESSALVSVQHPHEQTELSQFSLPRQSLLLFI